LYITFQPVFPNSPLTRNRSIDVIDFPYSQNESSGRKKFGKMVFEIQLLLHHLAYGPPSGRADSLLGAPS
jgi:hypothetical protein